MKDEYHQILPDTSSQKSVTEWLMQVISGKKTPEPDPETSAAEENGGKVEDAGAIAQPPIVAAGDEQPLPEAKEISPDEVCRVPEEPRLKPLQNVNGNGHYGEPEAIVTAADLLKEPAAFVEPSTASAVALEEREITIADISRAWLVEETERRSAHVDLVNETEVEPETTAPAEPEAAIQAAAVEPEPVEAAKAAVAEPVAESAVTGLVEAAAVETQPEQETTAIEITTESEAIAATAAETEVLSKPQAEITESVEVPVAVSEAEISVGVAHAEPVAENVWAREGFWEAAGRRENGAGDRPRDFRELAGRPTRDAVRGYLGSYLEAEDLQEIEKAKPEGWSTSWRTLLRLGSALPWLARALPMLEGATLTEQSHGLTQEVRNEVAGLRLIQYEIRTTVQDHSAQLKRMEEQLARVRDSVDSKSSDNAELADGVKAAARLMFRVGIGLGLLLVVLIVMAGLLLAHGR